jgi:hypothetical protein
MRVLILALSVMEILISEGTAKGGPSTANHDLSASVDPATFTEEATQGSEDQIGLDKGKRRDVQRPLTDSVFLMVVPASLEIDTLPSHVRSLDLDTFSQL